MLWELSAGGFAAPPILLILALILDAVLGELGPVFRILPHPVAAIGALVGWFDRRLNRERRSERARAVRGLVVVVVMCLIALALGVVIARVLGTFQYGWAVEVAIVAILVAQRGLFDHVRAVVRALDKDGVKAGRAAVRHIVGRDPQALDEHGVARAAMESLAENFADGVVAPAFWYVLLGLPGLLLYKTVNTMDSMIGHKTPKYAAFGRVAARLDDLLNLIPARLAGFMIALAALFVPYCLPSRAGAVMLRDAGKHPSPNAGWPEAALAGAVSVALLGPRSYGGKTTAGPWLGEEFTARATTSDMRRALYVYVVACLVNLGAVVAVAAGALAI